MISRSWALGTVSALWLFTINIVQMCNGFVGKDDDRTIDDRTCEERKLPLTRRQTGREGVGVFGETAFLQR